ncbi:tyrosine-type recombinase/integrase [Haloplanus salilacus]|uniref:tyrosine-type recombinase/integrase n=1 Tax=Haloplanus salilacus TaxID=2949994 RepID=UPI0030CE50C5
MRTDGGPSDLDVDDAVTRWLGRLRLDHADATVESYRRRLLHFLDWCDEHDIDTVGEVTAWDIDEFDIHRREEGVKSISLNNELTALRLFLRYCERVSLVGGGLSETVEPPTVPDGEETNDEFLAPNDARDLLATYRNGRDRYTREHAVLEVAWWIGCRKGGLAALDLDDYDANEGYVRFRHRPETGTPLKNGPDGERVVGLGADTRDALDGYIEHSRHDTTDEHGRRPLFATAQGRAHINTLTKSVYFGTVPCRYRECPHGNERPTCKFYSRTNGYKCPSSVSPHPVRSGSIMWQLNCGMRPDRVAERVNATVEVIETYYDKVSELEDYRERRADDLDKLGFDDSQESDDDA